MKVLVGFVLGCLCTFWIFKGDGGRGWIWNWMARRAVDAAYAVVEAAQSGASSEECVSGIVNGKQTICIKPEE